MASPTGKGSNRGIKSREPITVAKLDPHAPVAVENAASDISEPKTEEIARLAYSYWEARGCHGGSAEKDWLRAEQAVQFGTIGQVTAGDYQ